MGAVQGPSVRDCYIYVNDAALWLSAEERCILKGGHLASISGALVNSFLAVPAAKNCSPEYWIGGAWNLEVPKAWVWTDGRPFRYTNWAQGQPRQTDNTQCLAFDARTNLWYGEACNLYRPYVCRVPAITSDDPHDPGTTSRECDCPTLAPQAPTTASPAECTTAKAECACPTTSNWSFWTCPTASTFATEKQSTSTTTVEHTTSSSTETHHGRTPSTTTSSSSVCPSGWTYGLWSHKCYYGAPVDSWANWTWSDSFCKGIGAELVSIHSVEENVWLSAFLASSYNSFYAAIGLYKDYLLGKWRWSDGSPFEYAHWLSDECDDAAYASISTPFDSSAYPSVKWYCSRESDTFADVLCQKHAESDAQPAVPTLPTPPAQKGSCPTGWTYGPWTQKCYYFAQNPRDNEYHNWTWNHSFCKGLDAELASVHSEVENLWLSGFGSGSSSILGYSYAIGLYKNEMGEWLWSDGSAFDYSHFDVNCDPNTASYGSLGTSWELSSIPSLYWTCENGMDTFFTVLCQKEVD